MTDPTARPAAEAATDAAAEPDGETASPPVNEANKIAELVEALARESADYKDKHLRTLAEMENLRRRTDPNRLVPRWQIKTRADPGPSSCTGG